MAEITETKNGKYLKKTDANSYVHYQFDTNDDIVYLSNNIEKIQGEGDSSHYAKDTKLHETLCALYTLASKGGQASTDLAELAKLVNGHLNNTNNPHQVDKNDVKLGSVVNAPMDNTPTENSSNYVKSGGVYTAVKNVSEKVDQAISIANGQSHAYVFADVAGLKSGTLSNNQPIQSGYKVGDSIYIIAPDVPDFWISGFASTGTADNDNAIKTAKKGETIVVKWGTAYVSLTALESKRDLTDYITTSALNNKLNDYYNKTASDDKYVPYSGAKHPVNLGDNTLTVSDGKTINPTQTIIDKGNITLSGSTIIPGTPGVVGQSVNINVNGISVGNTMFDYPDDTTSGTLATQGFVTGKGYQTETQVDTLIKRTSLTFGGDIIGTGRIGDQVIGLSLTDMADLPTADTTFSAVKVNKKGRVTAGGQQIVFAPNLDDPNLSKLVIGGVAIIDA